MSEDLRALEVEYNYLSSQINQENESKYPSIEILCRKKSRRFVGDKVMSPKIQTCYHYHRNLIG